MRGEGLIKKEYQNEVEINGELKKIKAGELNDLILQSAL